MKRIFTFALITVMMLSVVLLVACGSKKEDLHDSKYVGTWKISQLTFQDESGEIDNEWTLEINGDGTGKSVSEGETNEFTWSPTEDGFKTKGDLKLTFKDDGDKIVGDLFGVKLIFEKQ